MSVEDDDHPADERIPHMRRYTQFVTQHEEGAPIVTATSKLGGWSFDYPGGGGFANCTFEQAEELAATIAQMIADLSPLRRELKRREHEIGETIQSASEATA